MEEIVISCDATMAKAIDNLKNSFKTIRSGVVSPNVLDKVYVDYCDEKTPLKSMASVSAPNSTSLLVTPFDPSTIKEIVGALNDAALGVNPVVSGTSIRMNFPSLNGDRRKEFVKQAKGFADQAKVTIRTVRGDYMNKVKKNKALSKDMVFDINDDLQKTTDKYNKVIDTLFATKEKELMTL